MSKTRKRIHDTMRFRQLVCGTALVCVFALSPLSATPPAQAQALSDFMDQKSAKADDSRMLLSADELVYDREASTITARGNVQVEYDGNHIVAQSITYNQATKRVMAHGNVEIVDSKGTKLYADQIDLTDDLGEGFINSLQAETTDKTYFAAESAERSMGQMTVFNNGAYTACEPCYAKPDKDVLWQVKAKRIIWNAATKTMRFEDSRFEMFGKTVGWLPVFEMADPTVKRKSGFLAPAFSYKSKLGFGMTNSYFWNLAPHYDFTFSATGLTKQGVLAEGEWRHRLENGSYNVRFAHIYQNSRDAFNYRSIDRQQTNRYMLATKGQFELNPRWKYGWDVLAQSDHNFARTYDIKGYNRDVQRSKIYLTGLSGRNYFDMRLYHFNVQENLRKNNPLERASRQPWVLPRIDYTRIADHPVYGGELKFTGNMQVLYRDRADFAYTDQFGNPLSTPRLAGMHGTNGRLTGETEWKRTFIGSSGFVLTPVLALRGDGIVIDTNQNYDPIELRSNAFRGMATAGLEARYPLLFSALNSSHIIEPVAQIFARNNEQYTGKLVNEDAQSFVFDATTLFQRDKFSGYDRVEGGTRANLGVRYSGNFDTGWSLYGLAGQSYHLSGRNSFAARDVTHVGADSGLEKSRSDYVAMLGADNGQGFSFAARGRFDEGNMAIKRGELDMRQQWRRFGFGTQYAYIESQPEYGYKNKRQEVSVQGNYKFNDNWQTNVFASYDLVSETLVRAGTAFSYEDECFAIMLGYMQTRNPGERSDSPAHKFSLGISFRTIGDFGISSGNR
ncbi:MAG: LPS-assembly protein LptD (precursor) [Candidatus Tokpelaia hoelldobleri]|uniref:LPS-assembly protein LptD n=1 Tax=Candidatus Tokpelaia hoelldobleri TaxID=1902579 RepID=A0A1U9JUN3_9HYPH|nr:MAG: LPS-assembly protein LptD (precursor) [Candidatus Tokpelaia hoelldoblerii]